MSAVVMSALTTIKESSENVFSLSMTSIDWVRVFLEFRIS